MLHIDEFEKLFIQYREHLRTEVHRLRDTVAIYRQLRTCKDKYLDTMNLAPAFFQIVEGSLFTTIVLWIDKLLDERGERGFFNFLTLIENNRKWLSIDQLQRRRAYPNTHWMLQGRKPIMFETIAAHRAQIRSLSALPNFRLRRDKFHGHFDKDYFFERDRLDVDAPIDWSELDEACVLMGSMLNDYSADFDGRMYFWEAINVHDLASLLSHAQKSLAIQGGAAT